MNEDFKKILDAIDNEVYLTASMFHLSNDEIEPITDGIGDPDLFLTSDLNTTWVCKEPYDDEECGKPIGGGWSLTKDCFMKSTKWPVNSWQRVIYIMYGVKHNFSYKNMAYISEDPEMGNILREVPWINISKMPGFKKSNPSNLVEAYKIWGNIVSRQISAFNTRIVIFGGTFDICKKDFILDSSKPIEVRQVGWVKIEVYEEKDKIFINAPHPGFSYKKVEPYVDTVIDLIKKYK